MPIKYIEHIKKRDEQSNAKVVVRSGRASDLPAVSLLYSFVAINEYNIEKKINAAHEGNFYNSGGIFSPYDLEGLNEIFTDDGFGLITAYNQANRRVDAMLSFCSYSEDFNDIQSNLQVNFENINMYESFLNALKMGQVFSPIDFIVHPNARGTGIVYPVFSKCYQDMLEQGYSFSMLEIYTIEGYSLDSEYIRLDMKNQRSFAQQYKAGAFDVGYRKLEKQIGDYKIFIKSTMLATCLQTSIDLMSSRT